MYSKRFIRLLISMPVFAFGATLSIQSGIGVNAWDTFALGITNVLPIQYGTVVLLTGIFVLLFFVLICVFGGLIRFLYYKNRNIEINMSGLYKKD